MIPRSRYRPRTLYRIAFENLQNVVTGVCREIFVVFGEYEEIGCRRAIWGFQNYLQQSLTRPVFQQLVDEKDSDDKHTRHGTKTIFHGIKRIRNLVYCHQSITRLRVGEWRKAKTYTHKAGPNFSVDCHFWYDILLTLRNLVSLELCDMSVDSFLIMVGETCKKLEELYLCTCIQPALINLAPGTIVPGPYRNDTAMVSDEGLKGLLGCQELRIIRMGGIRRMIFKNDFTKEGVYNLMLNLPKLEFTDLISMGQIFMDPEIQRQGKIMNLTAFYECEYHPLDFCQFGSLFPKIQDIILEVPDHVLWGITHHLYCNHALGTLIESGLDGLTGLKLIMVPYTKTLNRFITLKGSSVTEFIHRVSFREGISSEQILHLGQHCPNLVKVWLSNVCEQKKSSKTRLLRWKKQSSFPNVKYMTLTGCALALPAVLLSTTRLKTLVLHDTHKTPVDQVFFSILSHNKLKCLQHVTFKAVASMEIMTSMCQECDQLQEIAVLESSYINQTNVKRALEYLRRMHLYIDLKVIKVSDLYEIGTCPR